MREKARRKKTSETRKKIGETAEPKVVEGLKGAKRVIQILTTTLTPEGSRPYINSIMEAYARAKVEKNRLEVTILASHPTNKFLKDRADQLRVPEKEYRQELADSLKIISGYF